MTWFLYAPLARIPHQPIPIPVPVNDLLQKALQGVDPDSPDASMRIFENIMSLVPWWPLFWFTVLCVVVGAALGWWRRRMWLGVWLALLLGPIGWFALWAFPPGAPEIAAGAGHKKTSDAD